MSQPAPKVLETQAFHFFGAIFSTAFCDDNHFYVPIYAVCDVLGIDSPTQIKRIKNSSTLAPHQVYLQWLVEVQGRDAVRSVACIDVEQLATWLASISLERIAEDKRPLVARIQSEFLLVTRAHFRSAMVPEDVLAEMDTHLSPEMRTYFEIMAKAAAYLRENAGKMEANTLSIANMEKRILGLEEKLSSLQAGNVINEAQASRLRRMVAALGTVLAKDLKIPGGYGKAYNTLYKEFKITSYQLVPAEQWEDVVRYMRNWYQRITPPGTKLPECFTDEDQLDLFG